MIRQLLTVRRRSLAREHAWNHAESVPGSDRARGYPSFAKTACGFDAARMRYAHISGLRLKPYAEYLFAALDVLDQCAVGEAEFGVIAPTD